MKTFLIAGGLAVACLGTLQADKIADHEKRFRESAAVFGEIISAPDKSIPRDLLDRANCVAIVPGLKRAGFIVGAKYGKGVLTCRTPGGWSAPRGIKRPGCRAGGCGTAQS